MRYDLEERTGKFGENVIRFCKNLLTDTVTKPIVSQLVRSATSIGANYMEANGASSKKDFRNKIFICKKESQETLHWLRMLLVCYPVQSSSIVGLRKECEELTLIFGKIVSSIRTDG